MFMRRKNRDLCPLLTFNSFPFGLLVLQTPPFRIHFAFWPTRTPNPPVEAKNKRSLKDNMKRR
jgi:hypothetical protein